MSDYVFPLSLAGLSATMTRTLLTKTTVQEAASGKEWRTTWYGEPRFQYTINYEFLRQWVKRGALKSELSQLFAFFARHLGQWDSFLLNDPEDNIALQQYVGIGDTVIVDYQLQRIIAGILYSEGSGADGQSSRPVTNLCPYSQTFTVAGLWDPGTDGGMLEANIALAPDGTPTAGRVSTVAESITGGVGHARSSTFEPPGIGPYCASAHFCSGGGVTPLAVQVLLTGSGTSSQVPVVISGNATAMPDVGFGPYFLLNDSGWCRLGVYMDPSVGRQPIQRNLWNVALGLYTGQRNLQQSVLVWGAQAEAGVRFGRYVPTPAGTPVTRYPTAWPSIGDGSAPVYELRSAGAREFYGWPSDFGAGRFEHNGQAESPERGAMDWQGQRYAYTGRTNLLRWGEDFSKTASWVRSHGGSGSDPTFSGPVTTGAPDGSVTRGSFGAFAHTGLTSGDYSAITQTLTALPRSQAVVFSMWVGANPTEVEPFRLEVLETISGTSATLSVPQSQPLSRVKMTFTTSATGTATIVIRARGDLNASRVATSVSVGLWGGQLEIGSEPTHLLPTGAAPLIEPPEIPDSPTVYMNDGRANWHGTRMSPTPRVNWCANPDSFGSWSGTGASAASGQANPDDLLTTASLVTASAGTAYLTSSAITPSAVAAVFLSAAETRWTASVYVRAGIGGSGTSLGWMGTKLGSDITSATVDFDLTSGTITRAGSRVLSAHVEGIANNYWRVVTVIAYPGTVAAVNMLPLVGVGGAGGGASTNNIIFWRFMLEPGVGAWFAYAGASSAGDYVLGDNGAIVLAVAPRADQYITWTGGFYRRVRLASDTQSAERAMEHLWDSQSIELVSVKP